LNGKSKHADGKLLNGHGGKSAAGAMASAKSGILAMPKGRPSPESRASA
jgi:hypothetical protein